MRILGVFLCGVVLLAVGGCATKEKPVDVLAAPAGTSPAAGAAVAEGNRLFRAKQFAEARLQYEAALGVEPALAEAHYNLARALEYLGDPDTARKHYLEAASLAPGHKIIWNSPPLRRHGNVGETSLPDSGTTPVMSPLGGFGGGPGY